MATTTSRPRTVRFHLTALVFASVVPVLIFAVIVTSLFDRQQRESLERSRRDTARALAVAVDQELLSSISTLQALATSDHLDTGDLKAFYAQAQRVLKVHQGWRTINLMDRSGQQLVNLLRPFGTSLPHSGNLPVVRRTIETSEVAISDLFIGPVFNAPIIGITVPVLREGRLVYVLAAGLDVASLGWLLGESKLPPESVAMIFDRQGTILARTRGIEQWLGKPAPLDFVTQSRQSEEGANRAVTKDGVPVYGAYRRSRLSEWTVGLAVPVSVVDAPAWTSLWVITGGGIVFLLLAAGLATVLGRRLAGGIASLSATAREHGEGKVPVATGASRIAEIAVVEREMAETARERAAAEATARALAEVGRELVGTLDVSEAARKVASAVLRLFKARQSTVFQVEQASSSLRCIAVAGETDPAEWIGQRFAAGEGVVGRAVADGRPVWTSNLVEDPRFTLPEWARDRAREEQLAAVAAVPLKVRGEVIGALSIGTPQGRVFTEDEVGLLSAFADQAALAFQSARLYSETDRRRHEAEALAEVGRTLSQSLDVTEVARRIVAHVRALFDAENAAVFRLESEELVTVAASGDVGPVAPESVTFPAGTGVVGLAVRTRQVVSTADLLTDPRVVLPAARGRIAQAPYRAVLAAPLIVMDRVIGALGLGVRSGRVFTDDETALVKAFADQAATALENARLYQAAQHAYEDLKQAQDQLVQAQKMESVARLAGGVAHDFNNLLTIVAGRAQLALGRLDPESRVRGDLDLIKSAAMRAAALTRQLLALGRKQVLQIQVVDLPAVVDDVRRLVERTLGEDITITTAAASDLGRVKADPTQLEQVLMNLVVNARDAMPRGGQLTIEMSNVELDETYTRLHADVQSGPYVMLAVSDTGTGMDRDTRARIFEPFFTTKEPGKGTGLGLATVYGIVKQSNGHIAVYSELGRGTTFKVYLPRVDDVIPALIPESVSEVARGSETILLVEDEEGVRDLAHEVLTSDGYTVLVAQGPGEAILAAERHPAPIHLVVTDVVMPKMNGPELVKRLTVSRPDLRVLYMSGYADGAIQIHGVLEAGLPFLQKPFTPESLSRKVREAARGLPRSVT